jgi:hypothetical protein
MSLQAIQYRRYDGIRYVRRNLHRPSLVTNLRLTTHKHQHSERKIHCLPSHLRPHKLRIRDHLRMKYLRQPKYYFSLVSFMLLLSFMSIGQDCISKCGHKRVYCSSPRWNTSSENHGGMTSKTRNPVSSTIALWQFHQQNHLVTKQEEHGERNVEFLAMKYLLHTRSFFNMPQICGMVLTALTSLPKEVGYEFSSPLKIPSSSAGFEPANHGYTTGPPRATFLEAALIIRWDISQYNNTNFLHKLQPRHTSDVSTISTTCCDNSSK